MCTDILICQCMPTFFIEDALHSICHTFPALEAVCSVGTRSVAMYCIL